MSPIQQRVRRPGATDAGAVRITKPASVSVSVTAAARPAITDDEVMASVRGGSTTAFGVLYDRYHERAYRVARAVVRDNGHAQEVVQETFIGIWRTRSTYEDRGNVSAWVTTVARNRSIDYVRRDQQRRARRASAEMLDVIPLPEAVTDRVMGDEQRRAVVRALAEIPDAQREVVALAFYGELTHVEIAAHLNIPLGTVKGRLRLAMQRLRTDLVAHA